MSCLQVIHYTKLEHPLIGMVIRKCVFLTFANKDTILCRVPSHVGIRGNEKTDSADKSALELSLAKVGVPYTDVKRKLNYYILSTWQDDCNGAATNKINLVKPVQGAWQIILQAVQKG